MPAIKTGRVVTIFFILAGWISCGEAAELNYEHARWTDIHSKPAIDLATDEQCLSCHQEVISRKVRKTSPAGLKATDTLAWYQTLTTYEGEQETFHRRHISTPFAKQLMTMKCTTCHQGNDLREEAIVPPDTTNTTHTLRKSVNPEICVMCHGSNPFKIMGLPGPWAEVRDIFQDNCLLCHANTRTERHKVNFLKADAIELAGKENSDVCYGCHGGRAWYRIGSPYPRHAWPGMGKTVPEWAENRPTESDARFLQ